MVDRPEESREFSFLGLLTPTELLRDRSFGVDYMYMYLVPLQYVFVLKSSMFQLKYHRSTVTTVRRSLIRFRAQIKIKIKYVCRVEML